MEISKKDMLKCLDMKKIYINLIVYLVLYLVIFIPFFICLMNLYLDPTFCLIVITIPGAMFLFIETYTLYRFFKMLTAPKRLSSHMVSLDKINWYMNDKIPVFAIPIKTELGTELVETNAIFKKKEIYKYKGKKALVLYDNKKNRVYIVKLLEN